MTEEAKTNAPDNPDNHPLFVSTTGEPVLLALLSGHSASVGTTPTPLHPRFHRVAVVKGVVPGGMRDSVHQEETQGPGVDRKALLLKCVADMVAAAADDPTLSAKLFTNDGNQAANLPADRPPRI